MIKNGSVRKRRNGLSVRDSIAATAVVLQALLATANLMSQDSFEVKRSYSKYKVIRTLPVEDKNTIEKLMAFEGEEEISFWKYPSVNGTVDIMTSPEKVTLLEETLKDIGLEHYTIVEDVEKLFENQNDVEFNEKQETTMSWDQYHRYQVIMNYAKQQAARDDKVSYQSIGTSTEGREIGLVKISSGGNKPAIWLGMIPKEVYYNGGTHAREWISPATVTYIMHKLITDNKYKDLLDKFDWYIVPIINVDGYEYSHTEDRLWRKTRSRNSGSPCIGVDPNRNFSYKWGTTGTSTDPCSDTYCGKRPFSEPETSAVANAVMARRNQIKMFLTVHSYSQVWIVPYGDTSERVEDYNDLYRLASHGAQALAQTYGTQYRIGSSSEMLLALGSGGGDDWAKGYAGIKYTYTLELRDTGTYGFALPASQIEPTGEETLEGVAAAARALHDEYCY